jgi:flavin reductase (DIM6/NTAB) family NADH-FMN oxidoreductase RutF
MTVDVLEFSRALSQFATGVAVITAQNPGGDAVGLTIGSFNSVSLEPPLILFNIRFRPECL